MSTDNIIEVKGLYKRYGLPPFCPWNKREVQDHEWALRDINFSVPRGGSLGILGRNGAGKSTLLKVLAGVTPPDKGSIKINGSIFPMIELTAGMSMELSGRENIGILGTIMGLSSKQIKEIIPKVEEFSELEEWLLKPVWQYSSGMVARLAFGIAMHIKADILLVDEVLSTGDIMFQKKSQLKVQELLGGGTTLIFVSHSPYQVEKLCMDALLLNRGDVVQYGDSASVMKHYLSMTVSRNVNLAAQYDVSSNMDSRPGTGDARITKVELLDLNEKNIDSAITDQPLLVRLHYLAKEDISTVNFNLTLFDSSNSPIAILSPSRKEGGYFSLQEGVGKIDCIIQKFPALGIGLYFSCKITTTYLIDLVESAIVFDAEVPEEIAQITGARGLVFCKSEWNILGA